MDAATIQAVGMAIALAAILGAAGYYLIKKFREKRKDPGENLKVVVLLPDGKQETHYLDPLTDVTVKLDKGPDNPPMPLIADPKKARRDRTTGELVYYTCGVTGLQYEHVVPHPPPESDEPALKWTPMSFVHQVLDSGLVELFFRGFADPWYAGLIRFAPWILAIIGLFAAAFLIPTIGDVMRS
jgi:hypothetical protein